MTYNYEIEQYKKAFDEILQKTKRITICSEGKGPNNGLKRIQIVGGNIKTSSICRKWRKESANGYKEQS